MVISKYDIVLVNLNPTKGSEQSGIRPCLVIQNNGANMYSNTTVVCAISSKIRRLPNTIIIAPSRINNMKKESKIDILQIRTIDKARIIKTIGQLDKKYHRELRERINISFDLNDIL